MHIGLSGAGTCSIEKPQFPLPSHTSSDSSVGRAVDCSGIVIHRSLVQIRLRGDGFSFANSTLPYSIVLYSTVLCCVTSTRGVVKGPIEFP